MPDELELAELVTLYKKGNVENPANYRPISLLNTLYKIYASIIQIRLATGLDDVLWETQYGFRKKRSTSQPLFITRRLQDHAECTGDKLFMVFLDWEKAFDKVDQEKLIEAMERLNIPKKLVAILRTFYINPRFRVKDLEGKSTYRKQNAGIRQGCPLSPYLFICLMSVMFKDIHTNIEHKLSPWGAPDHMQWWEMIYADDTMLIGKRARELNILIAEIETMSSKYNLRLNYSKCNYVAMNGKAHIHFSNGKPVTEVDQAIYLGGEINKEAGRLSELNNRINKALITCNKLKTFWSKTNCSYKWKLQVYNAVIVSQLTYGLSTVQLTPAMLKRLDAFQMRGFRYILKIEHAYYSRVSNQEIYDKINIIYNKGTDINISWQEFIAANHFDKPRQLVKLSEYVMNQQNRTLGHVIRIPKELQDPMRMITIDDDLQMPGAYFKRVGRPRYGWVKENCRWIYEKEMHETYDPKNQAHDDKVKELAIARKF